MLSSPQTEANTTRSAAPDASPDGSEVSREEDAASAADIANEDDHRALLCAAAALMTGDSVADVDMQQKAVELVAAVIGRQRKLQLQYSPPQCASDAAAQLSLYMKAEVSRCVCAHGFSELMRHSQTSRHQGDRGEQQQLEPLADSLRALKKLLKKRRSARKTKSNSAPTHTSYEAEERNTTAPTLRLA
jgi:hypothetical protein